MNKAQLLAAHEFRHACKEFDAARTIGEDDFRLILETGRLSPSSFGFEPWKFVVLQNMDIRNKLVEVSWGARRQFPTASHVVLILSRTKAGLEPESDYIQSLMRDTKHIPAEFSERMTQTYRTFLESDFKLWDNERAVFEWSCRQAYIALANMMTTAAMIGIDSCPIEGFQMEPAERILREAGILQGDEFGLACMVAFGYRLNEPRPKTRRTMEQVVEWVR